MTLPPRTGTRIGLVLALGSALALGGACGASSSPESCASGQIPFIAYGCSFSGFESWPSNTTDGPFIDGSTHVSGVRTVYINQLPAAGASEFGVGTLIVKVTQSDHKIFARAKRGLGYNATGAVDWEWFELQESSQNEVAIVWRGVGPPANGEQYGGDPTAGCNGCHALVPFNDYVLSPWLHLGAAGDAAVPDAGAEAGDDAAAPAGSPDGALD